MTDPSETEFEFEKDVEIDVEAELDIDVEVQAEIDKDVDIKVDVDVDVDIEDNFADFNIDVEAVGDNSSAELDLFALVTDELSMITASGHAAVDNDDDDAPP